MPLRLKLCTGASTGYSSATINFVTSKVTELLSDLDSAGSAWASVGSSGSSLTFGSSAEDNSASCTGLSGYKRIRFTTFADSSIVAYTSTTYEVQDGTIIISDSSIDVNQAITFNTHQCNTAACAPSSSNISFQGVITHELGHMLGVSHSEVNDDNSSDGSTTMATMFPAISNLSESRAIESLETDDQLAKQSLYPSSGFPDDTGGTISGYVRYGNSGQRGAHVTAFDLTTHRSIAGAFSGVTGTRTNPDGSFVIKGIPLDTDFALFVEPVQRTDVHNNLRYTSFNIPIQIALDDESEGYRTFSVEGYPDVQVADVRKTGNYSSGAGFSNAQIFRLTSSQRTIGNVVFFISNLFTAPNDSVGSYATLGLATYNGEPSTSFESPVITNSNPIRITLTGTEDLSFLAGSALSVTGTKSGVTADWSGSVNNFTYSGTTSTVSIHPDRLGLTDGTYTVNVALTNGTIGTLRASGVIRPVGWSHNAVGDSEPPLPAGGGCSIEPYAEPFSKGVVALYFLAGILIFTLRRKCKSNRC